MALIALLTAAPGLPPISWTCPMHPEVVDDTSGSCPLCGMKLEPIRLDLVWSCPIHSEGTATRAGQCRICQRDLARVIKALSWTCRVHPRVEALSPGRCPTCKRSLIAKYTIRPHGDHNPKHGGVFTMAPNNWHLEATHPAPGLFQIYVYDEYSKPFIPSAFTARLVLPSASAPGAHTPVKSAEPSVPLKRSPGGRSLEARIPKMNLPTTIAVKARFQRNEPEYHFDFYFSDYSKEPVSAQGLGSSKPRP